MGSDRCVICDRGRDGCRRHDAMLLRIACLLSDVQECDKVGACIDWRQRARDAESTLSNQLQVTVVARQAVADVVVERDAARAERDRAREGEMRALSDPSCCRAVAAPPLTERDDLRTRLSAAMLVVSAAQRQRDAARVYDEARSFSAATDHYAEWCTSTDATDAAVTEWESQQKGESDAE